MAQGGAQRRACRYLGLCRASVRYTPQAPDPLNQLIRDELRKLSDRHRRYGTPRMTNLLRRQGYTVNHKRVERLWRLDGLPLRRRRKKKRRLPDAQPRPRPATRPNEVWCYDFLFDRTEYGQKLKILTVLDEYTRECLEVRVEKRMDSRHVMETLDELMRSVAFRNTPVRTMPVSSSQSAYETGCRIEAPNRSLLSLAAPGRTALLRASMPASGTNV
jgi:putative transposase